MPKLCGMLRSAVCFFALACVTTGLKNNDCSFDALECGDGYEERTFDVKTETGSNGCQVKIYHKECYCGSRSSPTSCCGDNNSPFKSIYCVKNGQAHGNEAALPDCADAALSWVTSTAEDGYEGRVMAAEAAIRPKTSWKQTCGTSSNSRRKLLVAHGIPEDDLQWGNVTNATVATEDEIEEATEELQDKSTSSSFQATLDEALVQGAVATMSPVNRRKLGNKVCDSLSSYECTLSETPDQDSLVISVEAEPDCFVNATIEMAAAGNDAASYTILKFTAMPDDCESEDNWLSAKTAIETEVQNQRKANILGSLTNTKCPGFGKAQSAFSQKLSPQKAAIAEAQHSYDSGSGSGGGSGNASTTMELVQLDAGSGSGCGSGSGSDCGNDYGNYSYWNPKSVETDDDGYELYNDLCAETTSSDDSRVQDFYQH